MSVSVSNPSLTVRYNYCTKSLQCMESGSRVKNKQLGKCLCHLCSLLEAEIHSNHKNYVILYLTKNTVKTGSSYIPFFPNREGEIVLYKISI